MTAIALDHLSRLPRSALLTDPLAITRRQLLRLLRTPQAAIATITSPILFLSLFRYVFGGAIPVPGLSYVDYLVPAMLVQNLIFGGFGSASGLAQDATSGILDRLRSLPTPRSSLLLGRAITDTLVQLAATAISVLTGLAIGFRFRADLAHTAGAFVAIVVIGLSLFPLFAALGLATRNAETVQSVTAPAFLLLFVSSGFIPVATLPGWLRGFARNQPVTIFTDTVRSLLDGPAAATVLGHTPSHYLPLCLAWCAGFAATGTALALRCYRRA